ASTTAVCGVLDNSRPRKCAIMRRFYRVEPICGASSHCRNDEEFRLSDCVGSESQIRAHPTPETDWRHALAAPPELAQQAKGIRVRAARCNRSRPSTKADRSRQHRKMLLPGTACELFRRLHDARSPFPLPAWQSRTSAAAVLFPEQYSASHLSQAPWIAAPTHPGWFRRAHWLPPATTPDA